MKNLLCTIAIACAVIACGPAPKTDETKTPGSPLDKAEMAVMAVHDETMPQIETMLKLKKQVNARIMKLDSLAGTPAEKIRADEEQAQGRLIVRHLTEADSLMMSWMSGYKGDTLKKLPEADALRYLDGQQKKVDDVKSKINQSIQQANAYLRQ
ncbi:viral A-type inclusion protein [Fibrella sp. HMF5335]|uniref:Viral A-type inclusion protein n=1 Tax=Fibrella rubiginis TaxID=2817060 RepID=A0A939GL36_9BACT|nr:viral A-type inclusion protein [Fibrella rubiginis]MBO0938388.1 viral A-type inclusion protein [Fibrella rubiginis]